MCLSIPHAWIKIRMNVFPCQQGIRRRIAFNRPLVLCTIDKPEIEPAARTVRNCGRRFVASRQQNECCRQKETNKTFHQNCAMPRPKLSAAASAERCSLVVVPSAPEGVGLQPRHPRRERCSEWLGGVLIIYASGSFQHSSKRSAPDSSLRLNL